MKKLEQKNAVNLYLTLDILPGSNHNEIIHAYNRAKMTYTNGSLASYSLIEDSASESILSEIETAFEVLGNPSRRREYDLAMGYQTWTEEQSIGMKQASSPTIKSKDNGAPTERPERTDSTREKLAMPSAPKAKLEVVQNIPQAFQNFAANPEFEQKILACTELDGAFLRAVRIYRRMTPDQLAQRCKLSAGHITAIEEEESGKLHHPVYLRGHVTMMCQMLDIPNPETLAKVFVARLTAEGKLTKLSF